MAAKKASSLFGMQTSRHNSHSVHRKRETEYSASTVSAALRAKASSLIEALIASGEDAKGIGHTPCFHNNQLVVGHGWINFFLLLTAEAFGD
jgi:hypothetical protein